MSVRYLAEYERMRRMAPHDGLLLSGLVPVPEDRQPESRDHPQDGINVLAAWCARNVRVVGVTQQIDLSGPVGRMVASVLFGLAEIKWEYRRERQAAGIAAAKSRGVYRGWQKGTTKAVPQRAQTLRQRGLTVLEIATALGVSERSVFRYLTAARV